MCIATATDRYQVEAALQRCNMLHFFSEILTCTEVGSGKDRPDNAEITCEYQYGVSNEVTPGKNAKITVKEGKLLLIKDRV